MRETVLVLGAAGAQVPLIDFVQSKGYRTIAVSIPGEYPGFAIADRNIYCDVRDSTAILKEIADENIVAVMTDQTDLPVSTIAELAEKLGLAGNKPQTAITYTNKYLMREAIDNAGLPNIQYYRSQSVDDAIDNWHIYPAIVKPEDNQGSRGVRRVDNVEELKEAFDEALLFSKTRHVIVEEFFEGNEVVVEGFVADGKYLNFGIGDRKYFQIKNQYIPSQTIFPTELSSEVQLKILQFEEKLHKSLHPHFGMTHSEYLVNAKGEFRLVETALRGGGVYISSHLIPLYTGVNNYDILLNCSLGKQIKLSEIEKQIHHKASAYICYYLPEGEVVSIDGLEELKRIDGVVMIDMDNVEIGSHIGPMINKTHRLGPILVAADNRVDVDKLIAKVQSTLDIRVKCKDESIRTIIWS